MVCRLGSYTFDDSVILNRQLWDRICGIDLSPLSDHDLLITGTKCSGKTLLLLRCLETFLDWGYSVVVLDACVEEGGIALINILREGGVPEGVVMSSPPESSIVEETELQRLASLANPDYLSTLFPRLPSASGSLCLLDVSAYLEQSHAAAGQEALHARSLYGCLIMQTMLKACWLSSQLEHPVAVIMDEVQLPVEISSVLNSFAAAKLRLVSASHESSLVPQTKRLFSCRADLTPLVWDRQNEVKIGCSN